MRKAIFATMGLLSLAAMPLEAQGGGHRRLGSRSAFASLDTMALADSSEMLPLDPRGKFDSLMVQMLVHLDSVHGRVVGRSNTRIHRWTGFPTLAHPTAGILVNGEEIEGLLSNLRSEKELGGLSREEIERRVPHVVQFAVAHEYAHLIQYALLPRDSVDARSATRVIECAADITGGAMHRGYVMLRFSDDATRRGALDATAHFAWLIGAPDWLDGTSHPEPHQRTACIQAGQNTSVVGANELLAWALTRAREITSSGIIAGRDVRPAVSVDESIVNFVKELASLATRGAEVMARDLRGPSLQVDTVFVLRRTMPGWRCMLHVRADASTARCEMSMFTDQAATEFERLALSVREALAAGPWKQHAADSTGVTLQSRPQRSDGFSLKLEGKERARIDVTLVHDVRRMAEQAPPRSRIVLLVTSTR